MAYFSHDLVSRLVTGVSIKAWRAPSHRTPAFLSGAASRGGGGPSAHHRACARGQTPAWRRTVSSASSSVHQGGRTPAWRGNATLGETHQSGEPTLGGVALTMPVCQRGIISLLGGFVPLSHSKAQEVLQGAQVPSPVCLRNARD